MTTNPFLTGERENFPPLTDDFFEEEIVEESSTFNLTIGTQAAYNNAEFDEEAFFKSKHQKYTSDTPQREKEDQEYFDNLSEMENETPSIAADGSKNSERYVLYDPENDKVVMSGNQATRAIQTNLSINEANSEERSQSNERSQHEEDDGEEEEDGDIVGELERSKPMDTLFLDEDDEVESEEGDGDEGHGGSGIEETPRKNNIEPSGYYQDTPIVEKKRKFPFSPVIGQRLSPHELDAPKTPDNRSSNMHLRVDNGEGGGMASPFLSPIIGQKNSQVVKSPIVPVIRVTDTLSKIDELDEEEENDDEDDSDGIEDESEEEENVEEYERREEEDPSRLHLAIQDNTMSLASVKTPLVSKRRGNLSEIEEESSIGSYMKDSGLSSNRVSLGDLEESEMEEENISNIGRNENRKKKRKNGNGNESAVASSVQDLKFRDRSSIMRKLSYHEGRRKKKNMNQIMEEELESPVTPKREHHRESASQGNVEKMRLGGSREEFDQLFERKIFSRGEQRSVHPLRKPDISGRPEDDEASSLMPRDGRYNGMAHPRPHPHHDTNSLVAEQENGIAQNLSNVTTRTHTCPHCNSPFYVLYSPVPYSPSTTTIHSAPQTNNRPVRPFLFPNNPQPVILQVVNPQQQMNHNPPLSSKQNVLVEQQKELKCGGVQPIQQQQQKKGHLDEKKQSLERKIFMKQEFYKKSLSGEQNEYLDRYSEEEEDEINRRMRYYQQLRRNERPSSDPQMMRRRRRKMVQRRRFDEDHVSRSGYIPRRRIMLSDDYYPQEQQQPRIVNTKKKLYHSTESYLNQNPRRRRGRKVEEEDYVEEEKPPISYHRQKPQQQYYGGGGYTTTAGYPREEDDDLFYRSTATNTRGGGGTRRTRRYPSSGNNYSGASTASRDSMMEQLSSPLSRNNYNYLKQRYLSQLKYYESRNNNKIFQ